MSKSISLSDAEDLARTQTTAYAEFVSTCATVPDAAIREAREAALALQPKAFYLKHPHIRFIWELLDFDDHPELFRFVVDAWLKDDGSLQKAAQHVKRTPRTNVRSWSAFAVFRMKARDGTNWVRLDDHGRTDAYEPDPATPLPQTVIFIALTRLDYDNGFFLALDPGQYVCVDSTASLIYPPTGGGIGLAIWLRL